MSESDSHRRFGSPMDGPFSRPTPPRGEDDDGSPRSLDASFSVRAVLSDPAGVSGGLAPIGRLLVAFQEFDPVGPRTIISRGSIASLALRPGRRSVYA